VGGCFGFPIVMGIRGIDPKLAQGIVRHGILIEAAWDIGDFIKAFNIRIFEKDGHV